MIDFTDFPAGADDDGRRADRVVRKFLPASGLSSVYSAMRKGLIRINDKKIQPDAHICKGDRLSIASFLLPLPSAAVHAAADGGSFPYTVLFRNPHFIVIDKPYDIPVQGAGDCIARIIASAYDGTSLSFVPGPLHRLDRKTTGVLFFSWSIEGARWFSEMIAAHMLEKQYIALVQGTMDKQCRWEDYIEKNGQADDESFHTVRICGAGGHGEGAKIAQTSAEPLACGMYGTVPVSLARMTISTGRMHQIRAQSAFHGFPLLGDTAYGGTRIHESRDFFLHAYTVVIPPNKLGLPESVTAPLPAESENLFNRILKNGWNSFIL